MSSRLAPHYRPLQLLYRDRGLVQVLCHLARAVLLSFYHRQAQYILMKAIENRAHVAPTNTAEEKIGIECLIVESAEALQAVAREIPTAIRDSADQMKKRLERGCLVILARRPHPSGTGHEVIGYGIYEPGVFSALGRRGKVSSDILFNHYLEVLPKYRGQRIADVMKRAIDEHCRAHGFKKRCTVISPSNEPSLRSDLRYGFTVVGTVVRVSLLRGLVVWETPWESIERALGVSGHQEVPLEFQQKR